MAISSAPGVEPLIAEVREIARSLPSLKFVPHGTRIRGDGQLETPAGWSSLGDFREFAAYRLLMRRFKIGSFDACEMLTVCTFAGVAPSAHLLGLAAEALVALGAANVEFTPLRGIGADRIAGAFTTGEHMLDGRNFAVRIAHYLHSGQSPADQGLFAQQVLLRDTAHAELTPEIGELAATAQRFFTRPVHVGPV